MKSKLGMMSKMGMGKTAKMGHAASGAAAAIKADTQYTQFVTDGTKCDDELLVLVCIMLYECICVAQRMTLLVANKMTAECVSRVTNSIMQYCHA